MIKKPGLLILFLAGSFCLYPQKEKNVIDMLIEYYQEYFDLNNRDESNRIVVEDICPPQPDIFYDFFNTKFVGFKSLRDGYVKTFSFSDSLHSPLKKNLIVTSGYGMRAGKKHFGTDFKLNTGDEVCSIFCGKVRVAKWDNTYGNVVVIRNFNMSEAVYAHLSKILVSVNQEVKVGETIGWGGNTGQSQGPHLHFELRYKGFPINTIIKGKFLTLIPVSNP